MSISVNLVGFPAGMLLGGLAVAHCVPAVVAVAAALTAASVTTARLLAPPPNP